MPQDESEMYLGSGSRSCCTHSNGRIGYGFRVRYFDECDVVDLLDICFFRWFQRNSMAFWAAHGVRSSAVMVEVESWLLKICRLIVSMSLALRSGFRGDEVVLRKGLDGVA